MAVSGAARERDDIKRHFDVVAEGLRSEIRRVAEGVANNSERPTLEQDRAALLDRVSRIEAKLAS